MILLAMCSMLVLEPVGKTLDEEGRELIAYSWHYKTNLDCGR